MCTALGCPACSLVEMEVDGNRGLTGCLPPGTPPLERLCGIRAPCPTWTTDVLIGADITNTGVRP